ncbi:uncharacterized protein LOC126654022 [Mercurialis annua]|uniref:uncharacterized protein LOC126654022 n=1 Tax=Mercurialis annua TaxID=3986 RepID=UPI0021609663|nr:uncharacterized protein LOC126654022 [Mercurialis annua]
MNSSSSSSQNSHNKKSSASAWQHSIMQQTNKKNSFRNPFQDLNNGGSATVSSNSSASLSSIEAPKGCLRFFLSNNSSSATKTQLSSPRNNKNGVKKLMLSSPHNPKSAPSMRHVKDSSSKGSIFHKPTSQKLEKSKRNPLKSRKSNDICDGNKKPSLSNVKSLKLSSGLNSSRGSLGEMNQLVVDKVSGFSVSNDSNLTPLNKVVNGSGLNLGGVVDDNVMIHNDESLCKSNAKSISSNTKTPPVQASVSPEIQCGSSMVSSMTAKTITPVCYGAGFVASGVVDKRKCRPRGVLTVGEAKALDCFGSDGESDKENTPVPVNKSRASGLTLPMEASMHWLLSPCNEEDEELKENSEDGSSRFRRLEERALHNFSASPLSGNDIFSPDLLDDSFNRSVSSGSSRRKIKSSSLISPSLAFTGLQLYDDTVLTDLCSGKERKKCFDLDEGKSPLSIDSLGCGNIIQTPQSDSSSDRRIDISWLKADGERKNGNFDSELDSVAENLQMASVSPKSHVSIWDPTSSSFQFDRLTSPSNSVDLSHFLKFLDDRASLYSNCTTENASQSQMRISWREGLSSRIFEMDEFDSCRCLSDEEDDASANECKDDCLNVQSCSDPNVHTVNEQTSTNCGSSCTDFIEDGHEIRVKLKKEIVPQVSCSCAESISTDAGGLVRSDDSDWTLCYKNHLFQL